MVFSRILLVVLPALFCVGGWPRPVRADNPYQALWNERLAHLQRHWTEARAAGPLAALLSIDGRVAEGAVFDVLRSVSSDPKVHPLVAAQAGHELALRLDARGESAAAAALRARLGVIESFWVLGPFEVQGRAGLDEELPPEREVLDPAGPVRFDGPVPGETQAFRDGGQAVRGGMLLLDALLRPDVDAAAYALTYLNSPRRQRVVLRMGSPGPVKVWCNGRLVLRRDVVRSARPDQDAVFVDLHPGDNVLLVKSVVTQGGWRLAARITDAEGRAVPGVRAHAGPASHLPKKAQRPVNQAGGDQQHPNPPALSALIQKQVPKRSGAARAVALMDWALYLQYLGADDRDDRAAETVARQAQAEDEQNEDGQNFAVTWTLAAVAVEDNDRRTALEGLSSLPLSGARRCLVSFQLAQVADRARRSQRMSEHLDEALQADPDCWPAALASFDDQRTAGFSGVALQRLRDLAVRFPLPLVQRRLLDALENAGHLAEVETLARASLAQTPAAVDVLQMLASNARARGDLNTAAQHLRTLIDLRPDFLFVALDLAHTLEADGKPDQARAVLANTQSRMPGAAAVAEALGRLEARAGQLDAAVAAFTRSLQLRPQNPALRRYLDRLRGELAGADVTGSAGADLARAYAADAEALVRVALDRPPENAAGHPAMVWLDRRVVRVHDNGLSETFAQRVVQILTDRGARENQQLAVRYTPGQQEVEIRRARVFRRGATGGIEVSAAAGRDDRDLSEPWYGLYYDNRADVVSFDGLRAGDVLEVQYTVADVSFRNEMAGYFGDIQFVAASVPIHAWDYTLIVPKRRPVYVHMPQEMPGFDHDRQEREDDVVYRFSARAVPRIKNEPSMPGWAEVAPFVHVSTFKDWDDVGRWYWKLVAEQLAPDQAVVDAARQAVAGAKTLDDKVRAIHEYVIKRTRYVGLEFGIHGYKPYRVSQVLARRFGDCKDKASLMVAMYKAVGIDAELVLLRTRAGGTIHPFPASLAVFDHAIAYVPALDLYLDGTAEFSGMAELPYQDQGVMGLRVGPGGPLWVTTPVLPSDKNHAARTWHAVVDDDGGARIRESVTVRGQAAPQWREHYQTPGEHKERFDKVWNGRYPGAVVEDLKVTGTDDVNAAVGTQATVTVPEMGVIHNDHMSLPVSARPPDFLRSYARLSRRNHDLVLAFPWQHQERLEYQLPPGWRIVQLPRTRAEQTDFATFVLDVATDGPGKVIVNTALDVRHHRYTSEHYARFRDFLSELELALNERVVLQKETP